MRISDWSSDVCSSDLVTIELEVGGARGFADDQHDDSRLAAWGRHAPCIKRDRRDVLGRLVLELHFQLREDRVDRIARRNVNPHFAILSPPQTEVIVAASHHEQQYCDRGKHRSEEHTSELQSLMRTSNHVLCW